MSRTVSTVYPSPGDVYVVNWPADTTKSARYAICFASDMKAHSSLWVSLNTPSLTLCVLENGPFSNALMCITQTHKRVDIERYKLIEPEPLVLIGVDDFHYGNGTIAPFRLRVDPSMVNFTNITSLASKTTSLLQKCGNLTSSSTRLFKMHGLVYMSSGIMARAITEKKDEKKNEKDDDESEGEPEESTTNTNTSTSTTTSNTSAATSATSTSTSTSSTSGSSSQRTKTVPDEEVALPMFSGSDVLNEMSDEQLQLERNMLHINMNDVDIPLFTGNGLLQTITDDELEAKTKARCHVPDPDMLPFTFDTDDEPVQHDHYDVSDDVPFESEFLETMNDEQLVANIDASIYAVEPEMPLFDDGGILQSATDEELKEINKPICVDAEMPPLTIMLDSEIDSTTINQIDTVSVPPVGRRRVSVTREILNQFSPLMLLTRDFDDAEEMALSSAKLMSLNSSDDATFSFHMDKMAPHEQHPHSQIMFNTSSSPAAAAALPPPPSQQLAPKPSHRTQHVI